MKCAGQFVDGGAFTTIVRLHHHLIEATSYGSVPLRPSPLGFQADGAAALQRELDPAGHTRDVRAVAFVRHFLAVVVDPVQVMGEPHDRNRLTSVRGRPAPVGEYARP